MSSDKHLKQAVLDELIWEPSVNEAHIGVTAKDGVITLMGHVETYSEKVAAEKAARRVHDVKAVAEEIEPLRTEGGRRSGLEHGGENFLAGVSAAGAGGIVKWAPVGI